MTKELKMIQMILEKGEATFWDKTHEVNFTYNGFECNGKTLSFIYVSQYTPDRQRTYSGDLELEEPKSVYDQLMDALFGNTSTHSWERIDKIKGLIRQHEDFLREK